MSSGKRKTQSPEPVPAEPRAANGPTSPRSAPMSDASPDRNVDQIRDILFGGQMRDYERRFLEMSQRLEAESQRLHNDLDQRLGQLERRVDDHFDKLGKQLRQEIADRSAGIDDLETRMQQGQRTLRAEMQGGVQALESDLAAKDERQRAGLSELRALLLARAGELAQTLSRSESELRAEKVGRNDLAGMLTELALRLNGELD